MNPDCQSGEKCMHERRRKKKGTPRHGTRTRITQSVDFLRGMRKKLLILGICGRRGIGKILTGTIYCRKGFFSQKGFSKDQRWEQVRGDPGSTPMGLQLVLMGWDPGEGLETQVELRVEISGHRYPHFLKVHVRLLCFYKDLRQHLFLRMERNLKRLFTFMIKAKITELFQRQGEQPHPAPSRGSTAPSASHHQAPRAFNYVREHLCFIPIDCVHLLAICILRLQKS